MSQEVQLAMLSAHMEQRRGAILHAWRSAVNADPTLTSGSSLPRAQLEDHLPALLVGFEESLAALAVAMPVDVSDSAALKGDAEAHGLHRWQQGFDVAEVTRELSRFNECVVVELDSFAALHPDFEAAVMPLARRLWAQLYGASVSASTLQFFRLQQIEANSHVKNLEQALEAVRQLEQQHAELWQQAAHDLRGNLGVVTTAAAGLTSGRASVLAGNNFRRLLDRNVSALRHLLNDVTGLARLQGGLEQRVPERMDASALLRDLCEALDLSARERDLLLTIDGPAELWVEGDPVKIRRIIQNLVLNAIKYTRRGGVTVSWGEGDRRDPARWFIQVQDTGPGFDAGPGSPIAGALEVATDQANQVSTDAVQGVVTHADGGLAEEMPRERHDPRPSHQSAGEGIGLSIVKRLCELLDATISVESSAGVGTTFRVFLPREYDKGI